MKELPEKFEMIEEREKVVEEKRRKTKGRENGGNLNLG